MTRLFDCLSQQQQEQLLQHRSANTLNPSDILIGDVFRIKMTEENGITPKNGNDSRHKFFIILGCTSDGIIYGGVVINKEINLNLPPAKQQLLMEIRRDRYTFLSYEKSFVDCATLKEVNVSTLMTWEFLGHAPDEDLPLIIGTLRESRFERKEKLRMYGLLTSTQ